MLRPHLTMGLSNSRVLSIPNFPEFPPPVDPYFFGGGPSVSLPPHHISFTHAGLGCPYYQVAELFFFPRCPPLRPCSVLIPPPAIENPYCSLFFLTPRSIDLHICTIFIRGDFWDRTGVYF